MTQVFRPSNHYSAAMESFLQEDDHHRRFLVTGSASRSQGLRTPQAPPTPPPEERNDEDTNLVTSFGKSFPLLYLYVVS